MRYFPLFLLIISLCGSHELSFPLGAGLEGAQSFNASMVELRSQLKAVFDRAAAIAEREGEEKEYQELLKEMQSLRAKITQMEEGWHKAAVGDSSAGDEAYALWDVGETTVSQLIMEYGATDHLYIIPQELSSMKISLFSSIPLPRECWSEMLEMVLAQNGVGVKMLNPFVRQLYIFKLDPSAIQAIVSKEKDLSLFSNYARLIFVFSPPAEQLKSVQSFLERFSDPKQTTVQAMGTKILLSSTRESIEKLLGLYHVVWEQGKGRVARLFSSPKISVEEAEKVLKMLFGDAGSRGRPPYFPSGADELSLLPLPQGLVLIGEPETVERGQQVLSELECQMEDPGEKIIYWYCCKHANPEDVAEVLSKVYDSLMGSNLEKKQEPPPPPPCAPPSCTPQAPAEPGQLPGPIYPPSFQPFNPVLPATAPFVQGAVLGKGPKTDFGNFIVDAKTTSILMVVRREELSKIKTILKKLDVPKRMVQLDVLLVEKKLTDRKQVGINLLKLGTSASNTTQNALSFDNEEKALHKGILSFLFSRTGGDHGPALDLTYNFLMAQEDVRINANPSILAINQTPAIISIVEEISIDNGAIPVQLTAGSVTFERSYTRAQYGTTIKLTPTIHISDDDEGTAFVSLETNLEFDTTHLTANERPPVSRRHIENQVCIADGETVILGGLRRKLEEDARDKIPFLGDLPGVGKLFGLTKTHDINTEMFVFITPRVIHNPVEDLRKIRMSEYVQRAGDIPEFLEKIDAAKHIQRKRLFDNSIKMLFDFYDQ
ncbi:MAG: type II secretion system protein GspD [Verrucomicrobiota bacterium]|nr:type II secretion system protein GspD [Verrucomicrobiota bacterium]